MSKVRKRCYAAGLAGFLLVVVALAGIMMFQAAPAVQAEDVPPDGHNGDGHDPPPPTEGCTPGFWKNHLEQIRLLGIDPGADFDTTFSDFDTVFSGTVINLFDPDKTILGALTQKGKDSEPVRHVAAAFLNIAAGLNFEFTVYQVIEIFWEGDAGLLVTANEAGCPLDGGLGANGA